jgi:hypothetical protein
MKSNIYSDEDLIKLVAAISSNPKVRASIFIDGLCDYDRNPDEFSYENIDIIELINKKRR